MARMTSPERLSADIAQILKEYEDGVIIGFNKAIQELANKGRNAVRRNARSVIAKGRRKYSNGWMYKMERGSNKWAAGAVIYEKRQPGLAHLLEHGHALASGGRTGALEHIKPVEEQLIREAISEVKKEL